MNAIVDELRGEKIDIVKYSEDPAEFIAAALAPADVVSVQLSVAGNACRVEPIPSSQWPQKAPRPPYTVRACGKLSEYQGVHPRPWTQALREHFFCDPFDA